MWLRVHSHDAKLQGLTLQTLDIYQSLWAMEQDQPGGATLPLSDQFSKIAEAGFAGVDIVHGDFTVSEVRDLLQAHKLGCSITAFPDSSAALQPAIDMALALNAVHLNVIAKIYPFSIDVGVGFVRECEALCASTNLPLLFETHRDCLTTDLHYTLQLMDAAPEINLSADLSHYVVGREFSWPITSLVQSQIQKVLDRSNAFQGRVASREQIQLQISFPHHRDWFDLFSEWWLQGFRSWRSRAANNARLNFLCELGPPEYAITDVNGQEMSSRWTEALLIKQRVAALWAESADSLHR